MAKNPSSDDVSSLTSEKDLWDKAEIVSKFIVPLVVAGTALWFNNQLSQRQTSAEMAQIAVGILSEEPVYEEGEIQSDPLREWAISVLQSPKEVSSLTDEAAARLRQEGLPQVPGQLSKNAARLISLPRFLSEDDCNEHYRGVEELFVELGWMNVNQYCRLFAKAD